MTQKAALGDPRDVYRSENARPEDWGMVGTHDTPSIWSVVDAWDRAGEICGRSAHDLADARAHAAEGVRREAQAFRDLLVPDRPSGDHVPELLRGEFVAQQVRDLFGLREEYNVPGTVGPRNWSLRVPPAYVGDYGERLREGSALTFRACWRWRCGRAASRTGPSGAWMRPDRSGVAVPSGRRLTPHSNRIDRAPFGGSVEAVRRWPRVGSSAAHGGPTTRIPAPSS